jgi:hypothetical protein
LHDSAGEILAGPPAVAADLNQIELAAVERARVDGDERFVRRRGGIVELDDLDRWPPAAVAY